MLDILETARETVATRADAVPSRKPARPRPELIRPRLEIECIQYVIDAVRNYFEQTANPALIDCYIYELDAAQLRYQFLPRRFKSQED